MPLSSQMLQELLIRLAAAVVDNTIGSIRLVGPELRCETVEDAERLVERFAAWQYVFVELREISELTEDRESFTRLYDTYKKLLADLRGAIQLTRGHGVPWEQTRAIAIADPRGGVIAAREIRGAGVIDSAVAVVTKGPVAWIRGDRVRVRRGDHEGRTGTVTTRPPSNVRLSSIYAPYAEAGDGDVQVALDGEPGDGHVQVALDGEPGGSSSSVGPGARAAGGRGGIPIVVAADDLEPYEGPPGRGIRR